MTKSSKAGWNTSSIRPSPRRRLLRFALLGAFSGALSAAAFSIFVLFAPGFIFGAVFAPLLVRHRLISPFRSIAWLGCATVGYLVAMSFIAEVRGESPLTTAVAGLVAGTLGGGFLAAITRFLIPGARWLIPTAVGALLGLLFLVHDKLVAGPFIFFMIWQGGYAAALAIALPPADWRSFSFTNNEHEYPYLTQLIGGWFHQDFDIAGNTRSGDRIL